MAIDQSVNALMLGDFDETISSRAGRLWPNSLWTKFINLLVWWEKDHCQTHIEPDIGKDDLIDPVTIAKH